MFQEYEVVYISELVEGDKFVAGWYPYRILTKWDKVLNIFGMLPSYEFVCDNFYGDEKLLKTKIPKGYSIQGVRAWDDQGTIYVSDIRNTDTMKYLDYFRTEYEGQPINPEPLMPVMCAQMGLERLPELYSGPYSGIVANKCLTLAELGIVIKPYVEKLYNNTRKIQIITTRVGSNATGN
jgi:hypothetical protein